MLLPGKVVDTLHHCGNLLADLAAELKLCCYPALAAEVCSMGVQARHLVLR